MKFNKILIINIFGVGDVLFTTPMIRQIKNAFHDVAIGYVANARTASLLRNHPLISKVFIYERDEFHQIYKRSKIQFLARLSTFVKEIKSEGFDAAIDLSLNSSADFLLMLTGIKTRIGYNYKNRSPFLTQKFKLSGYEGRHVVDYYNDLLSALGIVPQPTPMEFPLTAADRAWAMGFLKTNGLSGKKVVIGIVPGGGASWGKDALFKRWEPQNYVKLADNLIENCGADIILMGDEKERELCERVAREMRGRSFQLCGKTSLSQFAAVSAQLKLVVVNDGGPLHMAVAAGAKTVSIFGPVDEKVYGPYAPLEREQHLVVSKNLACRPCYRRFRRSECEHISCLHTISVQDVLVKVESLLEM